MIRHPAVFLILLCVSVSLRATHAADKPNIVFIFADDWGWGDLSCHGHPYVKTPNIDRLAKEGTDFSRFTVASGVCSRSRTAVLTGHFPARYNIDGHFAWPKNNARPKPLFWKMGGGRDSEFHWANYAVNRWVVFHPEPREFS